MYKSKLKIDRITKLHIFHILMDDIDDIPGNVAL
jgi:hypothetical protein